MLRLKKLRNEKHISQQKLASALGVSRSTIAMWETEASQPDNAMLIKISAFFNVSIDYILGNDTSVSKNFVSSDKNKIKELRKSANLSQLKFAESLGVHQTAVSQWENGRTSPDIEIAKKISEKYNVTLDYLLGNNNLHKNEIINEDRLIFQDTFDIAKDIECIEKKLLNKQNHPIFFNGKKISDETAELILTQIKLMQNIIKIVSKEK